MKVPKSVPPEVFEKICEEIASGETVLAICKQPGMPDRKMVYQAIAASEDYYNKYLRARESQMIQWEEEIVHIACDNSLDRKDDGRFDHDHINRSRLKVDTLKWILSKRLPKLYGERAVREHVGPDGGPIQTQAVDLTKLTDEELAVLEKLNR